MLGIKSASQCFPVRLSTVEFTEQESIALTFHPFALRRNINTYQLFVTGKTEFAVEWYERSFGMIEFLVRQAEF